MAESIFRPFRPSDAERSDRSAGDRLRHRQKIRESIRENIADIIAEESIIGKSRDRIIKVPIRGIREYRFVYGDNAPGVGQGDGGSEAGQVVGKAHGEGQGAGGERAGDRPGVDYYETDVTLEELIDIMFEDLDLPDLERKALRQTEAPRMSKRRGYRQVGIRIRLNLGPSGLARRVRGCGSFRFVLTQLKMLSERADIEWRCEIAPRSGFGGAVKRGSRRRLVDGQGDYGRVSLAQVADQIQSTTLAG